MSISVSYYGLQSTRSLSDTSNISMIRHVLCLRSFLSF